MIIPIISTFMCESDGSVSGIIYLES